MVCRALSILLPPCPPSSEPSSSTVAAADLLSSLSTSACLLFDEDDERDSLALAASSSFSSSSSSSSSAAARCCSSRFRIFFLRIRLRRSLALSRPVCTSALRATLGFKVCSSARYDSMSSSCRARSRARCRMFSFCVLSLPFTTPSCASARARASSPSLFAATSTDCVCRRLSFRKEIHEVASIRREVGEGDENGQDAAVFMKQEITDLEQTNRTNRPRRTKGVS